MKFAIFALKDAEGAVLAHSLAVSKGRIRKGTVLTPEHLDQLKDAGIAEVMAARLDASDVPEDIAARRIGERLAAPGLSLTKAFTGRANLV
ncbi:MAG: molybdopterin biosynthesis protein, partial [Silicimonas sp.]|nr:molybdopterin biosynthesis protein [Silicimonas sp.]